MAAEIIGEGGRCQTLGFDASRDPASQLGHMAAPTHVYYFAASMIFGGGHVYSLERVRVFQDIYVDGFYRLCAYYNDMETAARVFYPSSVAVENRPKEMTEYAMAKAAGEVLASDLSRSMRWVSVDVARLPHVVTDQTASLVPLDNPDSTEIMLPLVRAFHRTPVDD